MPWDIILTTAIGFIQLLLAFLGVYVSVISPKERKQVYLVSALFIAFGLLGLALNITQQIISKNEQKYDKVRFDTREKELQGSLYQSQLSQEYIKGQLNVVGQVCGKSGDNLSSAIMKLAESSSQTTTATNKQICASTMALVKRMHNFARDRKDRSSQLSNQRMSAMRAAQNKAREEQDKIWQQYNALDQQQWSSNEYEFRTTILGEAKYLKDELLKRLPPQPKPDSKYNHVFDYGSLAGVYPEEEAADYLENLTRQLCPK